MKAYITQEPARLLYGELFNPTPYEENGVVKGKPRFEAHLILDPLDYAALLEMAVSVASTELSPPIDFAALPFTPQEKDDLRVRVTNNPGYSSPFQQGDRVIEARQAKVYAKALAARKTETEAANDAKSLGAYLTPIIGGRVVMIARSGIEYPPLLGALVNGIPVEFKSKDLRPTSKVYFYNGVLCYPTVNLAAYKPFGGGVNAYLQGLFSVNTGDKLGGGIETSVPKTDFSRFMGKPVNVDPTVAEKKPWE
jgi:hypothetical protein